MLKSYFKIALRNIYKHKVFSIINITGLAIGIACSILIMLYVNYELSYDSFNVKANRTYRIAVKARVGNTNINQTYSSAITFKKLLQDYPEIETGLKFLNFGQVPVYVGKKTFYESNCYGVDSTFYDIFTVPLISGDPEKVLAEPNTVVLSKSTALKYFNSVDVVGKILTIDFSDDGGKIDFKISGVSENMPQNSHLHYNILISNGSFPSLINAQGWSQNNFISYIVLKKGTSEKTFDAKLKEFTRKYMGGSKFDQWEAKGNFWIYYLQPLKDIHLDSDLNGEFEPGGNKTSVYIFSVISIIILLIACINFMNLSTARSSLRAKEVGLRKVVGSDRSRLIFQFIFESVTIANIALGVALLIVELFLPLYRNFTGIPVGTGYLNNFYVIISLLLGGLFVGIFSGFYPAFVLSSFQPIKILKNEAFQKSGKFNFRNVLVIIQFATSIILIAGTLIIYQQLRFIQNKNLGFDKEQVLVVNNPGSIKQNIDSFKQSLRSYNNIMDVSGSNTIPGKGFSNIGFGAKGIENNFTLNICSCDYGFAKTMKLEMEKGRFFSKEYPSDSSAIILNQQAVNLLGWKDPIGKTLNNWAKKRGNFHVVGVVKDYNYESLRSKIRPMALFLNGGYYKEIENYIMIRLRTGNLTNTLNYVHSKWSQYAPGAPFDYSFLDKDFDSLYMNERKTMQLFTIFSALAIFIACLGLLGLVSFNTEQKTKEIGIRKILGASVPGIIILLIKEFIKWVLIANVLAFPLAYYFMNNWLKNFAYRIIINVWIFAIAGVAALIIAIITVSYQAIKAATSNPTKALKYE